VGDVPTILTFPTRLLPSLLGVGAAPLAVTGPKSIETSAISI